MKRSFSLHTIQCAAVLTAAAGFAALSPAGAVEVNLYNGEVAADAGITLGSWGGSKAEETTDEKLNGDRTIKLKARDLYQGARLDFSKPFNLAAVLKQPNAYLLVTFKKSATAQQINVVPGGGMGVPGMEGGMMMGPQGGMEGMPGLGNSGTAQIPPVSKLRALFIGAGKPVEACSVGDLKTDDGGWTTVGIPLSSLKDKITSNTFSVKRLVVSADSADTIYIARVALVNDNNSINAQVTADRYNEIKVNNTVSFTATAAAGITPLHLSWDFDASNGIQEDAIGDHVEYSFLKPGRYTVTLTARAEDNAQKDPATETVEVEVVP
ncbi:MAG TPA: PKD domain-containing protein [Armatimonadota bacterium]|nr:PKD domain-containing protein [Armatimonadota bacterium]